MTHDSENPRSRSAAGAAAELMVSRIQRRVTASWRVVSVVLSLWRMACDLLRRPTLVRWLGPYLVSERIGQGGMGVIYKASHPLSSRPLAIKLLSSERSRERDLKRFEREARVTSSLRHPNTVSVYDFGRTRDGALYYVMEYLEGLDLQTLVEVEGPQAPARVARVLAQLAGALAEVHDLGLLHGDVKPANVVCCGAGSGDDRVKLLDFGLVRPIGGRALSLSPVGQQAIAGTPLYLSPEALVDPARMDGRSDLYALGAIGYFLLTGVPPFAGTSILEVFTQHVHVMPVPPSERRGSPIPYELEAVVMSCLAKSPEGRPRSAAVLREALLPSGASASLVSPVRTTLRALG